MTVIMITIGITAFGAITLRFLGLTARVPQKARNR